MGESSLPLASCRRRTLLSRPPRSHRHRPAPARKSLPRRARRRSDSARFSNWSRSSSRVWCSITSRPTISSNPCRSARGWSRSRFLAIYWRYKAESLSVFVFPLVFVMTLVAALRNPVSHWSSEAVRSTWLIVHIVLALLGYAALLFTAVAAVAYLMQERQLKQKQTAVFLPAVSAARHAGRTDLALARRRLRLHHRQHHHRHRLGVHRTRHELDR